MGSLWRLIRTGIFNAFDNMAIDHVLFEACYKETGANTVRFYRWSPSAVSIGRFQHINDEVDVEACQRQKIDVVRRISSGGAVFHDFRGELTYSIICRVDDARLKGDLVDTYQILCQGLQRGLHHLGVKAEFSSGSENFCPNLFVAGRKISGNAQSRRGNTILQHGTILVKIDLRTMFSVLKMGKKKAGPEIIERAAKKLTSLDQELGSSVTFGRVEEVMIDGITDALGARFYEEPLTPAELASARHVATSWYAKPEWIFQRGLRQ